MWHGICSVILAEVLTGEALLQEGAATTNELKDCGEMFSLDAYRFVFEPRICRRLEQPPIVFRGKYVSFTALVMGPSQSAIWAGAFVRGECQ